MHCPRCQAMPASQASFNPSEKRQARGVQPTEPSTYHAVLKQSISCMTPWSGGLLLLS